jgi:GNAT superfamily N-acetyltransferase
MSVRPDRQRMGVGTRLIRDALGRAEQAGEPAVMVDGFVAPHPKILDKAFMVKRLPGYTSALAGRIVYPAAFGPLGY